MKLARKSSFVVKSPRPILKSAAEYSACGCAMVTLSCVLIWNSASHAQAWMDPAWPDRAAIVVTNPSALPLSNFQIELELNNVFPFSQAQPNGADIRVTQDDGVTLVDHWIKAWDPTGEIASLWIEVPLIPPNSEISLYIYFGNASAVSGSDGDATFLFFDDFNDDPLGYFALSGPQTTMVADLTWETRAPHTMSVIEMNGPTYKYWGYYALQGGFGGVGRARSHDLVNWVKDPNPLFTNGRWASTLLVGGTVHMLVTKDFPLISHIVLRTSTDGINFTEVEVVVSPESGIKNQNPHLFYNDDDGQYYLFWFRNNAGQYEIWGRAASAIQDLDVAASVLMRSSPEVLAAPNMMFWNGTYFLTVETFEFGEWRTRVFESDQVFSRFTEVPDNPLLTDGGACFFQHIFDDVMHAYYCKLTGTTWTVEHRSAPLLAGRTPVPGEIDQTKWEALGGSWSRQTQVRHDGVSSNVAQAVSSADNTLMSLFSGTDYVLEGFGRLERGRVWGLNVRVIETGQIYTSNLYEDLDGTDNLYLYRFHPLTADEALATSALGPVAYDDWYEMKVSAHGDTLDVYLDGDYKHTGTDLFIPTGAIGLYGEVQTVAYFEDIRVRKYAAAQPTVALMLGPQVPLLFDASADLFLSIPAFILVALMIAVANMVSVRRGR